MPLPYSSVLSKLPHKLKFAFPGGMALAEGKKQP